MGNCSVTLEHTQGYVAGGLMTMMAILVGCFSPSELFLTILIMGCCVFVAMLCFLKAASKETLDETGIYLKTSFAQKHYPWASVEQIVLAKVSRKDIPHYYISIKGRRTKIAIDYTKRSQMCISRYYGQPDCDKWRKPPELL